EVCGARGRFRNRQGSLMMRCDDHADGAVGSPDEEEIVYGIGGQQFHFDPDADEFVPIPDDPDGYQLDEVGLKVLRDMPPPRKRPSLPTSPNETHGMPAASAPGSRKSTSAPSPKRTFRSLPTAQCFGRVGKATGVSSSTVCGRPARQG